MSGGLVGAAIGILTSAEPDAKVARTRAAARAWRAGEIAEVGRGAVPPRPARPERPELRPPKDMPRRSTGASGRVALFHALAHIELNAIDLAWDLIARFADAGLPRAFYDDWVRVADDEARHFALLAARLAELGHAYGDLPAHDGLWEAAEETAHDPLARLAVVPLVLEARGLDVLPDLLKRLERAGDTQGVAVLTTIYREEIDHVAAGKRWFDHLCAARGLEPRATWQALVRRHFRGQLKAPFNRPARDAADLPAAFYETIAQTRWSASAPSGHRTPRPSPRSTAVPSTARKK